MSMYDRLGGVRIYIEFTKRFDDSALLPIIEERLPRGASILELGMGPGRDLDVLTERYRVTGSDSSRVFLDSYRSRHPDSDLVLLDATVMDIDRRFDCIYSNKVLHHLSDEQFKSSLRRQRGLLNPGGCLLHGFAHGQGEERIGGLRFKYRSEELVRELVGEIMKIVRIEVYTEDEEDDSIYVLLEGDG
jgi:ubiquinone/menaquinone biosynthesis C-methylase UbiE